VKSFPKLFQKVGFSSKNIVLYDAHCGGCSRAVSWLKRMDKRGQFVYFPLQKKDELGIFLPDEDSVMLVHEGKIFLRSEAVMKICVILGWPWKLFNGMVAWIPLHRRDSLYSWVAKNRHRFFGKNSQCSI
jgi:predicted DCC family thiol-disulfide oxidoreductase YuxK